MIHWDTDTRFDLEVREGHIRGNTLFLTVGLTWWMERTWGGVLTHVKTSTQVETGEVLIFKARSGEPGAVPAQRLGAQNAVKINFWRPLRKLQIQVPADRQFNLQPTLREVPGLGTVFVFAMHNYTSVPRGRRPKPAVDF